MSGEVQRGALSDTLVRVIVIKDSRSGNALALKEEREVGAKVPVAHFAYARAISGHRSDA